MLDDLHALPKIRDGLTSLYVEHAIVDRHEKSIAIHDADGVTPAPAASLAVLMLGPGTKVTHAAVQTLAQNNCLTIWCGEENVRFYALGTGGTRSAAATLLQARLWADERSRLEVVKRMYRMRFLPSPESGEGSGVRADSDIDQAATVEFLRGMEGVRVREAYARASRETGVEWSGRNYDRGNWSNTDPVNRALSCANSCLYGICHAAILATGFSPAIGFIHTGKQLSFVYDVADLYKVDISIPIAFRLAGEQPDNLERAVRYACRDAFRETKLLQRIVPDIRKALGVTPDALPEAFEPDEDPALPTDLWTPEAELAEEP